MSGRTQPEPTQWTAGDARREALFVSALQPSDGPTVDEIAVAIVSAMHRFGAGGCAARMAEEFGNHPEAAAARMRWARQLAAQDSGLDHRTRCQRLAKPAAAGDKEDL
jgi:hypothetical protein